MKHILVLAFLCAFTIKGYCQNESKYIGVYIQIYDGRLVSILVLPDHQFFSISSSVSSGTWKECDGNLIIYPILKEKEESIRLYGRYDDKFPADSIYINFKDLEDLPLLYSFNNVDNKSMMHYVYNLFPNCFNISGSFAEYMSRGVVKKEGLNSIQLMPVPDVYSSVRFNDSKNKKFTASILGRQRSFLLPPQYNDYQIAFETSADELGSLPFMGTLFENGLYFEGHLFGKKESLQNYDKVFLDSLTSASQSVSKSRRFSEYRYEHGYEDWVDYEYQLIADVSPDIDKAVSFDLQYLITENCNDNEGYNDRYSSIIIEEDTRKSMAFWKTFSSFLRNKDIDRLVTMIDFPLLKTTEEDSIGTQISKEDFLADFDQLFSPNVVKLFKEYNVNSFLKDKKYNPETIDDDGRIYSLDFYMPTGSMSGYVREKDQMVKTEFILGEKDGNLRLKEISTQIF